MNGLSDNSGQGRKVEDLDGVLNRFQDWTKSRQGLPAASSETSAGLLRTFASKKTKPSSEARELTYEEALRKSRYRRPAYSSPIEPKPAETSAQKAESQQRPARARTPKAKLDDSPLSEVDGKPPRASTQQATAPQSEPESSPSSQKNRPQRQRTRSAPAKKASRPANILAEVLLPTPDSVARQRLPHAPFREVFADAAGAKNAIMQDSGEGHKSIALSLRVSDAEQARIQASAMQANLSVSAYLRQCALGVDELRDHVKLALGELRKQESAPIPPLGVSAIPRILAHFAAQCFRQLSKRQEPSGLSLH